MAKAKNLVRIRYDGEHDGYCMEISTDNGKSWGLSHAWRCVPKNGETDTNYVHYSLVTELSKALDLGYQAVPYYGQ